MTAPGREASHGDRPRRILHVLRRGEPGEDAADLLHDWVVRTDGAGWSLDAGGAPPHPPGSIDDDVLVQLFFAADLVVVW